MVSFWWSDQDVQVLQEKVIWGLEAVVISDPTSLPSGVWNSLPQFLHKCSHRICLVSVGVAAQVVFGMDEAHAVSAWCVGWVGVGESSVGLEWGSLL